MGKAEQKEIGDDANLTISFAGELLEGAEELIRMGLHPSEIITGYSKAINKTVEILNDLVEGSETMDVRDKDDVIKRMKAASVAGKQYGQEDILCNLIADACIQVCPKNPTNFIVDNIRVAKLLGGGLNNSSIVQGMVLKNDAVGTVKRVEKAKVAVFVSGVDTTATETKETVLIHSAEQLENYAKTEEAKVGQISIIELQGPRSFRIIECIALDPIMYYALLCDILTDIWFCRTTGAIALKP
ncbi:T-complex protein 1 subunit theta-like [Impatiens glandulifera]|uniref:T-complex protein 1 subunit theta-like n=1 Tax=Impatiens glandulifera TaxID=253017 RepID=UPI001FB181C0|nr:T-complex protein 1 subunit theta-like [Impatiens glandulifera]